MGTAHHNESFAAGKELQPYALNPFTLKIILNHVRY